MTMHIVFENVGEIDPLLIRTFGVNVKESDDAIGFFGTGLKYALAILCRATMPIIIQSGERVHRFERITRTLRGKDFDFVAMDGEPMGFTTEVGKNWQPWMAYRELFCNCQDEGGRVYESDEIPAPASGISRVIVSDPRFVGIARDHKKYFLTTAPFVVGQHVEAHRGMSSVAYYRRVKVGELGGKPTLFTYNATGHVTLTEDRTMSTPHSVNCMIARMITESTDRDFIRACVVASNDYHESDLDFEGFAQPTAEFMEVVEALIHDTVIGLNESARRQYERHSTKKTEPTPHTMNAVEQKMLDKAIKFCADIGFDVSKYPIHVVESLGPNGIGLAANGRIYLSQRAFSVGTKYVASTLVEEYIHLKLGLHDCTRDMQNHLFDLVVSLGERLLGEPV
jgi:hypothetical protein